MPGFAGQLPLGWGVWLVRSVSEVPPAPDWPAITAAVESAFATRLQSAPRLAPGSELSRQRRYENRAADRQGRVWTLDAGLIVMPSYPFGCECGKSGCRATWTATPDDYAARTASQRPLIAHDTRLLRSRKPTCATTENRPV